MCPWLMLLRIDPCAPFPIYLVTHAYTHTHTHTNHLLTELKNFLLMENMGDSYIADGNVKWNSSSGKELDSSS